MTEEAIYPCRVELELDPPQPAEVTQAVADALAEPTGGTDPWWRAGVDEQLET
jgi:hypothetical protein